MALQCRAFRVETAPDKTQFLIHTEMRPIGPSVVAISYAWGAGELRPVQFGVDSSGTSVYGRLGEEWDVRALMTKLAEISKEGHWIWLDQLSINQADDAEVTALLASIPLLYKSCNVKVLLPVGPCSGEVELYKATVAASEQAHDLASFNEMLLPQMGEFEKHFPCCTRGSLYAHFFTRLWTRQEVLYATSLQMLPVRGAPPCSMVQHDLQLALRCSKAQLARQSMLREKLVLATEDVSWKPMELEARFMLGQQLEELPAVETPFLRKLEAVAVAARQTTDPRDYVLAVWPDLEGYVVPAARKQMSAAQLLQDAADQYLRLTDCHLPAYVTRGMIGEGGAGSGSPASSAVALSMERACSTLGSTLDVYAAALGRAQLPASSQGGLRVQLLSPAPVLQVEPLRRLLGSTVGANIAALQPLLSMAHPNMRQGILLAMNPRLDGNFRRGRGYDPRVAPECALVWAVRAVENPTYLQDPQEQQMRQQCDPDRMLELLEGCLGVQGVASSSSSSLSLAVFQLPGQPGFLGVGKQGTWSLGAVAGGAVLVALEELQQEGGTASSWQMVGRSVVLAGSLSSKSRHDEVAV